MNSRVKNGIKKYNIFSKIKEGRIMYNYKIDDDTTNKIISTYNSESTKKGLEKVVDEINKINNNFLTSEVPEYTAPSFEKMTMPETTKEEIIKQAEDSLSSYKKESLDSINNDISSQIETLTKNKIQAEDSNNASKAQIQDYYEAAKEDTSNDALKRGLSRSSIVINNLNALTKDEVDSLKALDKEYSETINAINFELNSLGQQKQKALSDFDIAYAVKLNDKINSLNEDLAKKQAEVIKYNNEIAEKELEYKNKYDEFVSDLNSENFDNNAKLIELTSKYGESVINDYKTNRIYDLLDSYFSNMSNDEILEAINDSSFRAALGSNLSKVLERYTK